MQQAKEIIAANPIQEIAERHVRLGFVNSEVVKKGLTVRMSKQQADVIEHYKQNYPFQKFITENELDRICEKYNLIYAPVSNYIKNVPEKNLMEIENASALKQTDTIRNINIYKCECVTSGLTTDEIRKVKNGITLDYDATNVANQQILSKYFSKPVQCKYSYNDRSHEVVHREGYFIAAPRSHFGFKWNNQERKIWVL